jgi:hypothetical protein
LALRCGDEALFARLLSQACIIAASHRLNSEAYISLVMKAWAYYGADHGAPPEEMAVRWRQAAAKFDAYFGSKEYILPAAQPEEHPCRVHQVRAVLFYAEGSFDRLRRGRGTAGRRASGEIPSPFLHAG